MNRGRFLKELGRFLTLEMENQMPCILKLVNQKRKKIVNLECQGPRKNVSLEDSFNLNPINKDI